MAELIVECLHEDGVRHADGRREEVGESQNQDEHGGGAIVVLAMVDEQHEGVA